VRGFGKERGERTVMLAMPAVAGDGGAQSAVEPGVLARQQWIGGTVSFFKINDSIFPIGGRQRRGHRGSESGNPMEN
jgi:hypothetical protein